MSLDEEEAREAYQELASELQDLGLGWIEEEVERATPLASEGEELGEGWNERLRALVGGLESGVVQPLSMLQSLSTRMGDVTIIEPQAHRSHSPESESARWTLPVDEAEVWVGTVDGLKTAIESLREGLG